jgi:PAT family beta-lactamase induction signal transducer AmpG
VRLSAAQSQLPLGFSAGLPLYLGGSTLGAWLAAQGTDIGTIAVFALVSLPYSLKFLWAPLFDCVRLPFLSRRRSWLLVIQVTILVAIVALALTGPRDLVRLAWLATALAMLSASQDILVDAHRVDAVDDRALGRATALYVTGYRVALIATGAGALMLAEWISWPAVYLAMAAASLVGIVATLMAPEVADSPPSPGYRRALVDPVREFLGRPHVLALVAVVLLFKLGDAVAGHMVVPYLLGLDYSTFEVGLIQQGVGMAATIAGAVVGGLCIDRWGLLRGLVVFGLAQALANGGYLVLAITGKSSVLFALAICTDSLCNGLGTAAFVAFLTKLCHRGFSATQYALLTGAATFAGKLVAAGSGVVIATIGWGGFWGLTIALAIPAVAAAAHLARVRVPVLAIDPEKAA